MLVSKKPSLKTLSSLLDASQPTSPKDDCQADGHAEQADMLPLYSDDRLLRTQKSVMGRLSGPRSGSKFQRVMQYTVLVCLLIPVVLLLKHQLMPPLPGYRISTAEVLLEEEPMNAPAASLRNLVLVAGHAVYTGADYSKATELSSWFLEDYQKVPGEPQTFLDHISAGVEQAARDPAALLLFSGGQTRKAAGPRSEGLSYWQVADAANWFNTSGVRSRAFTEEHARDSFENLLFSLCRFYELTGHYPDKLTVVSYRLKEERFRNLHRAALKWPEARFEFLGTELPAGVRGAQEGEARTITAFNSNPYGCAGESKAKKLRRDPFSVGPPHWSRCPDMRGLLHWCGSDIFPEDLPWSSSGGETRR